MSTLFPPTNPPREEGDPPQVGVALLDANAEPVETPTPQLDNNAAPGVVIDQNVTKPEDRGPNTEDNEAALEEADSVEGDPEADWIGDRLGAHAIDNPKSVYLSPALDTVDPPDLEEPEPEPELLTRPVIRS